MSYHGIYITTVDIPRTSLFDLPYGYELVITRVCGCVLYYNSGRREEEPRVVASEFPLSSDAGLKVEYGREVLCDSLPDALYANLEAQLVRLPEREDLGAPDGNLPDRQELSRIHRIGVAPKQVTVLVSPDTIDRMIERRLDHFDPGSGDIAVRLPVFQPEHEVDHERRHVETAVASLEG